MVWFLYQRKMIADDLLKEAAEVFAYTAELLAAGDAVREAIFTCYQDLCGLLPTTRLPTKRL